ncbi:hypothetical protein HPB51_004430 [Rhipicephalus microplus]|uniref:G-protein coupled receptors family 1 profile domain-containing protein n=1 Tax=Rhipicephalus microplus TaxID=6941 RepID=A0A9J6EM47_RHIMP|nr:hypothetical protein HPB51_004430 [Rhipicephalus microplus]
MLLLALGPKRDPLTTVIPMTLIYSVLLVSGVVGNVCTCIVIARNRYMHTATNYYLFSLAVSDLLLLVLGLPQELYQLWQRHPYVFGEAFCVLRGLTSETSTNASILTITAFTIERYVAICHPLRAHTMSKLSRAVKFVVAIWVLSAVCAVPLAVQFGIVHQTLDGTTVLPETAAVHALQLKRSDALSRQDVHHKCPASNSPSTSVVNGKGDSSSATGHKQSSAVVQPLPSKLQRGCQLRKSVRGGAAASSSRKAVINMLIYFKTSTVYATEPDGPTSPFTKAERRQGLPCSQAGDMTSTSRCFVHCLRPVVRAKVLERTATSSGGGGRCRRSLRAGMPPELSAPKCYFRKRITRYPAARHSLEPGQLSGTPGPMVGRGGAAKKIPFLLS